MTFHLHLGAHKTASTHLQATLIKHRAMLAEAGVKFVRPDDIRTLIGSGQRAAVSMGALPSFRLARARRRLAHLDQGQDRIVISDENSLGQCAEMFQRELLYATSRRRLSVWGRLAAKRKTVVYLSVRNYAHFLSGSYVQSIRNADYFMPSSESLVAISRMPRRWGNVVEDIRNALPDARILVWAYEDYALLQRSLLERMTGLELSPVNRRPMATPSTGAVAQFGALSQRNGAALTEITLDQFAKKNPISDRNTRFSLWNEDQSATLTKMYVSDLEKLRRDLGEDFLIA